MFSFKKDKNLKWKFALMSIVFALIFGLLGALIGLVYLWPQIRQSDFFAEREVNLNSPEYSQANLVIQDPKKVYISQDLQVEEALNYLSEAVVGIFPKAKNGLEADYLMSGELLSGLIISNDGWVGLNVLGGQEALKNIVKNKEAYILISKKNKKVYELEEVHDFSGEAGLAFVKIKSSDSFPSRNFVNISEMRVGQTLMAYNFSSEVGLNYLQSISSGSGLKFSDNYQTSLTLSHPLSENFSNSFIFNLSGDLLALVDADLKVRPIHDFRSDIFTFLKNRELSSLKWSLYYFNLSDLASSTLPQHGAWVHRPGASAIVAGGLAQATGLQESDIITRINNYEINANNSFNDIINNFISGDNLSLFIIRQGQNQELKTKLK